MVAIWCRFCRNSYDKHVEFRVYEFIDESDIEAVAVELEGCVGDGLMDGVVDEFTGEAFDTRGGVCIWIGWIQKSVVDWVVEWWMWRPLGWLECEWRCLE